MLINTDVLIPMTDANQNFSKVVRLVDEQGAVVILKLSLIHIYFRYEVNIFLSRLFVEQLAEIGGDVYKRQAEDIYIRQHAEGRYEHKLAMMHDDLQENGTIIGRSLSFGLFLACLGLLLTLLYILID